MSQSKAKFFQEDTFRAAIDWEVKNLLERLTQYVSGSETFHQYAMTQAGLNQEMLDQLEEEASGEYEDARHRLYWEVLTAISASILFEAGQKVRHFG